jgi:uncharacterized protein
MVTQTTTIRPTLSTERIPALDVLRGVAVLGILLLNIVGFGLVSQAYHDPAVQGGASGMDLWTWIMTSMLFEGAMRALFSMLFGAGMVLLSLRMEAQGLGIEAADVYYRRSSLLVLFGIVHAYFILWVGDVLFAYGLFGLFLFPLRKLSPAKLIALAAILTCFGTVFKVYQYHKQSRNHDLYLQASQFPENASLTPELQHARVAWESSVSRSKPDDEEIQAEIEKMHQGYIPLVLALAPVNRMRQSISNYTYNPWDVLPMMLLGIALYKLGVITAGLRLRSYLIIAASGYAIGLLVNYNEVTTLVNNNFSALSLTKASMTYHVGRIGMAIGHIGLIMIICKLPILGFLKRGLAAVGKMALTNYVLDSVICVFIFTGVGLALFGMLQRHDLYYVVAAMWTVKIIGSIIWLRYFRFGPLEWFLRSLAYLQWQPIRRN